MTPLLLSVVWPEMFWGAVIVIIIVAALYIDNVSGEPKQSKHTNWYEDDGDEII